MRDNRWFFRVLLVAIVSLFTLLLLQQERAWSFDPCNLFPGHPLLCPNPPNRGPTGPDERGPQTPGTNVGRDDNTNPEPPPEVPQLPGTRPPEPGVTAGGSDTGGSNVDRDEQTNPSASQEDRQRAEDITEDLSGATGGKTTGPPPRGTIPGVGPETRGANPDRPDRTRSQ
jgi:hypothetical protein